LIKILTPVVALLNKILSYAIAVVNAIAKIFGGSGLSVGGGGGGGSPLGGMADDAGDLSDNLGNANKNAKKFKATIAGFDELETLNPQSDDSGGGGLGGLGGIGVDDLDSYFDMGDLDEPFKKIEEWLQKIKDLWDAGEFEQIGREIAQVLNKAMYKLDE